MITQEAFNSPDIGTSSYSSGRLEISYKEVDQVILARGNSSSLEVFKRYLILIDQAERHFIKYNHLTCYFHFSMINASTTKLLFDLMSVLQRKSDDGHEITIYWVVEEADDYLIDIGFDLKSMFRLDFRITLYSERFYAEQF